MTKEDIQSDALKDIFMKVLEGLGSKWKPFMNRVLFKAFMHRSKLKNQYNIPPDEMNKSLHRKQVICKITQEREKSTIIS